MSHTNIAETEEFSATVSVAEMTWDGSALSLMFSCAPIRGQKKL